jgi:hypothetical protein
MPLTIHPPARDRRRIATVAATMAAAVLAAGAVVVAVPAPAGAVTGRTLVTVTSISDSNNKSVTAECPAGKKVIGAGGQILSGRGQVHIVDMIPSANLTSVTVGGGERVAFGGSYTWDWQVVAQAMCAPATSVPDLERVEAAGFEPGSGPYAHTGGKVALAVCPFEKELYGTGFEFNDAFGKVFLQKLLPNSGLDWVEAAAKPNESGLPAWSFTAYAICGAPRTTMTLVPALSAEDPDDQKGVTTNTCASGTTLAGTGAHIDPETPYMFLDRMSLDLFADQATINAWENQPGNYTSTNGPDWRVTGYAVCVS